MNLCDYSKVVNLYINHAGPAIARLWRLEDFLKGPKVWKFQLGQEDGIKSLILIREELADRICPLIANHEYVNELLPDGMTINSLSSSQKSSLVMFVSQLLSKGELSPDAEPFVVSVAIENLQGGCERRSEYIVNKMKENIPTKFRDLGRSKFFLHWSVIRQQRNIPFSSLMVILKELYYLHVDFSIMKISFSPCKDPILFGRRDVGPLEDLSEFFMQIKAIFITEIWEDVSQILSDMGVLQTLEEQEIHSFSDVQKDALALIALAICDQGEEDKYLKAYLVEKVRRKMIRNKSMLKCGLARIFEDADPNSRIIYKVIEDVLPKEIPRPN
jgi:hypothetical protein